MVHRVRILLLIPHLGGGGAEHVMALLACHLPADKYELHLGIVTQTSASGHALPAHVTIHALGARRVRAGALSVLRLVRRLSPDVVLSGMAHLNFLVLLLKPLFPRQTRVLIRQNATTSAALAAGGLPWFTRLLYRLLYPCADLVICQSQAMADDLSSIVSLAPNRLAVLSNPVDIEGIRASAQAAGCWTGPGPHLLAIGRLVTAKGFDLLLDALARVRTRFPYADLLIAGEGPLRPCLELQSMCMDLRSAVRLPGQVDHPYKFFPGADLFVLSSRHEGMPNVLLEAAAAGLPLVATPASGGVVDMLHGRPGVWLTRDVSAESLARALLAALGSLKPGERFKHEFMSTTLDAVRAYEEAIDTACDRCSAPEDELTQA